MTFSLNKTINHRICINGLYIYIHILYMCKFNILEGDKGETVIERILVESVPFLHICLFLRPPKHAGDYQRKLLLKVTSACCARSPMTRILHPCSSSLLAFYYMDAKLPQHSSVCIYLILALVLLLGARI